MPLYICKGRDEDGRLATRKIEVETSEQAAEYMKACGLIAVHIKKASFFDMDVTRKVTKKHLSAFCRQLSYMLKSGIGIIEALDIVQNQSGNKRLKSALGNVTLDILKGLSLSESMRKYNAFPELLINMTYVGELSGELGEVYESMAGYYERERNRSDEIKSALSYPAVVSLIMLIVTVVAALYLAPNYASIYAANSTSLPLPTRVLISLSGFLTRRLIKLPAALTLAVASCAAFCTTKKGKYLIGYIKLKMPICNRIYKKSVNASFSEVMSILLKAAYPVTDSLLTFKLVLNNPYLDPDFDKIILMVESGSSLAAAVESSGVFERGLCSMLRIGEESGRLIYALNNCSQNLNMELHSMVSKFGKLVEPTIIMIIGLFLAFVMLAIMLPSFNLGNAL